MKACVLTKCTKCPEDSHPLTPGGEERRNEVLTLSLAESLNENRSFGIKIVNMKPIILISHEGVACLRLRIVKKSLSLSFD